MPETLIETLTKYSNAIEEFPQTQRHVLDTIKSEYISTITAHLQQSADKHFNKYKLYKKSLQQEKKALQYYINIYHETKQLSLEDLQSEKSSEGEELQGDADKKTKNKASRRNNDTANEELRQKRQLQNKERRERREEREMENKVRREKREWVQVLKKINLYSLCKNIDDKISYNKGLLGDFKFTCSLPDGNVNHLQKITDKCYILQEQNKEYSSYISALLTKFNFPDQTLSKLHLKYKQLLSSPEESQSTNLVLKDSPSFILSSLSKQNSLKCLQLAVISDKGILNKEWYDDFADKLMRHRFYVESIKIKIMDMQFSQEKCDVLKRTLKKMKVMNQLKIQNYYSECKMGEFVDFNWHPYRKSINIKSGTWK